MSDQHEPPGDPPPERDDTGAQRAAGRDPLRLGGWLVARSSGVRGDAERSLERARRLSDEGDPRAPIALSACRDALGAYRDAVERSVRELCDDDRDAASAQPGAPQPRAGWDGGPSLPGGAPPASRGRLRERIAGALAVAGVAAVLGLVAWTGLPSASGPSGSAPNQVSAESTPEAGHPAGAFDTGAGSHEDEPRTARMAQDGSVRRVVASTLPPHESTPQPEPDARAEAAPSEASRASSTPADAPTAGDQPAGDAPAGDGASDARAGDATPQAPSDDGVDAPDEAARQVEEVVDAVSERVPEVGRRLEEALRGTSQQLLPGGAADGDADAGDDGGGLLGGGLLDGDGSEDDEDGAAGSGG